ncbi:MAG: DUF2306 domain-containing protein [Rhodothermaceae bacterium]|nr:DUF2306 domain-containing protein [Rhodothermaceae bacterium]
MLIATHTLFGVLALLLGVVVLVRPKATRAHRWLGYSYVAAMVLLCIESFGIRDATPFFAGFGMFHVLALVSLGTVVAGIIPALRRQPNWFDWHYNSMAWSYIGLLMATGSHLFEPVFLFLLRDLSLPRILCWIGTAGLLWGLPPLVGQTLLVRRERMLRQQAAPVLARASRAELLAPAEPIEE